MKNTFGNVLQIHSFGESHAPAVGCVLDNFPAGVPFREDLLSFWLARRRPGGLASVGVTLRQESDQWQILSGIFEGKTLGTPIAVLVFNKDVQSQFYSPNLLRRGHADQVWLNKFGHRDWRGGGRASARETVARVIAGAFAQMFLDSVLQTPVRVYSFLRKIGPFEISDPVDPARVQQADSFIGRFPEPEKQESLRKLFDECRIKRESLGAVVEVWVENVPQGLGQPVFHKLKSDLASAALSIPATDGILWHWPEELTWGTRFHHSGQTYGGILGGVSTGDNIRFQVLFKPTSSIVTTDLPFERHDPCVAIRGSIVVEAMTFWTIADHFLWRRLDQA